MFFLAAAGIFASQDSAHESWWNRIPGFFIIFGFLGAVLLVVMAKALGKYLIQKKEDYYDIR